jgi:cyanophycinase
LRWRACGATDGADDAFGSRGLAMRRWSVEDGYASHPLLKNAKNGAPTSMSLGFDRGHLAAVGEGILSITMKTTSSTSTGIFALLLFVATCVFPCSAQTKKTAGEGYTAYSLPAKAPAPITTPTYIALLLGGHGDVDEATREFCAHSGGGDIVVLRASEADEYNSEFHEICPGNSVTTLVITSRDGANAKLVSEKLRAAHAIYIAGGDQSNYVRYWTHTPVQEIINSAMARGVPIGGISAGLAVQGEFVFSSMIDTITSPEAMANPYEPLMSLNRDFLEEPGMKGIITDSHFSQRERMGRSIAFMSRIIQDGWASSVHGIGIDETTAVLLEPSGHAKVMGKGSAYFMTLDHPAEVCAYKKPLTVRRVRILKVKAGKDATFDFNSWSSPGAVGSVAAVDAGVLKVSASGESSGSK